MLGWSSTTTTTFSWDGLREQIVQDMAGHGVTFRSPLEWSAMTTAMALLSAMSQSLSRQQLMQQQAAAPPNHPTTTGTLPLIAAVRRALLPLAFRRRSTWKVLENLLVGNDAMNAAMVFGGGKETIIISDDFVAARLNGLS